MSVSSKPPVNGYFPFTSSGDFPVPAGKFLTLPNDTAAAAMVHNSTWEPRPQNTKANHTIPPVFKTLGNSAYPLRVWARITGRCPLVNPTTDQLIQWAAAKWGLPDNYIRAEMVTESHWFQNLKWAAVMPSGLIRPATSPIGSPVYGHGYGDYAPGADPKNPLPSAKGSPNASPAKSYNLALGGTLIDRNIAKTGVRDRVYGPASFGMPQCKWWVWRPNVGMGTGLGSYPWLETSTAYALDLYAAVIRAQYEGWNQWQSGAYTTYKANPGGANGAWGAAGNWFSGGWYNAAATGYIAKVKTNLATKPWLQSGF